MSDFFRRSTAVLIVLFLFVKPAVSQVELKYYLPEDETYDLSLPTPKSIIGHEVGQWHVTHDRLVNYFYELAEMSPRVTVEKIGETYETRPLLNVIITSEVNHKRLDEIRSAHLKLSDPYSMEEVDLSKMPVVVRLGYSVHGNEASGANSSLLVAYHLAASQSKQVEKMLSNCILLIDPCLNPDGLQRFSTWVNQHKSTNLNPDPNGREFVEPWPNGRTNHYWFDLNRDWFLAQHPESIARLRVFHKWRPNVQTDHHEMGSNATFFFQPGVPARKHPLIPVENISLTEKIGNYHASALDEQNILYYTKETFDDFYFGKGSTYPDIHGGIGILFEQASVRGHLRETQNGKISFPFAIKNQFTTSLSTVRASVALRFELLDFQRSFYKNSVNKRNPEIDKVIVFGTSEDLVRARLLGQLLQKHQIKLYTLERDIQLGGIKFHSDRSYVLPYNQPQQKLIKAIFERQTEFTDSLFYDVSAWNFDLAFNANLVTVENSSGLRFSDKPIGKLELPKGEIFGDRAYAYVIDWNQYYAPGFVHELLKLGIRLRFATEPFTVNSGKNFGRGSIMIPMGIQNIESDRIHQILNDNALKYHLNVYAVKSGFSLSGIDLGSNNFKEIRTPKVAMIVGPGASGYQCGEVWHLLDQRYNMHATMISSERIDRLKLDKYNTLVLPGGSYSPLSSVAQERVKNWVKNGGTLIAWQNSLRFVNKLQIADVTFKKTAIDTLSEIPYADQSKTRGAQVIGGAIFNMKIDDTHPLAYGYHQKTLAVFKQGNLVLNPGKRKISNPFKYTDSPLLSGYSSNENLYRIRNSPAAVVSSFGEGKVICLVDNPNFRAFWYGTNRIFLNAIFFGDKISTR